tara:strand:+ start:2295 stop:3782 length:1488 start_codon:yes stop_codon:yes gene_type:complete
MKTIKEVQEDLQGLLDETGADGFPRAKALYLKEVQITDAEGNEIDPDSIDLSIEIAPAAEEKTEEEHEEEKAAEEDEAEDKKAEEEEEAEKSFDIDALVQKAVSKALETTKNVKSKGLDMRIDNDREGLKRWGSLKHINRIETASGDAELEAYKFGRWAAACMGHKKSQDWCSNRGIETKAHLESVNSQGGFLVPDQFADTLISLRESYGVIRRNAKIEPMTSDTKRIPKRSATLSASFVGEATAGTETTQTFQQVNLVAKKLMVITTISNELNEDSLINLGDSVAGEIAYAFALKEDECAFLGDGTSTYGGIVGISSAINAVSSNAGIYTCPANKDEPGDIVLSDFQKLTAKLPQYADTPNAKFYMHKSIYDFVVTALAYAAGGNGANDILNYKAGATLMGYPVEFTQVMPSSTTADGDATNPLNFPVLFGDLGLATCFGDRRSNTVAFSDSAFNAFEQDEIVVRGTERFDFNCHAPGTSSEAGPVVAMKLNTN